MRDQLKDEISEEYQAKLALEAAVAEATEQMTRAKNLYAEYTSRVEDMTARERVLMAGEADVQARQEQVGRREATLKTREEWISKREGQFRVQQRALENAQLLPRGSLMTPPVPVAGSSAGSGSPRSVEAIIRHRLKKPRAEIAALNPRLSGASCSSAGFGLQNDSALRLYQRRICRFELVFSRIHRLGTNLHRCLR